MANGSDPYGSQLAGELLDDVLERFLRYVADRHPVRPRAASYPSTAKQLDLIRLLADELRGLGLDEVEVTEHGYVFATSPAVGVDDGPTVGLIAHVDTSPDAPGTGVEPQVWRNYDGGELRAAPRPGAGDLARPRARSSPQRTGHDLVTSDGTTLLGADDKAGVAEIMAAVAWLLAHPDVPRARARIGFTVDEEIGHGTDHFDLERFGADFAYTLDGQQVGEIENETFSAIELEVTFTGVGIHPGSREGPAREPRQARRAVPREPAADTLSPETTEGREGFVHPYEIDGRRRERAR